MANEALHDNKDRAAPRTHEQSAAMDTHTDTQRRLKQRMVTAVLACTTSDANALFAANVADANASVTRVTEGVKRAVFDSVLGATRFAHLTTDGDGKLDVAVASVSRTEASWMDPQQVALLHHASALGAVEQCKDRMKRGAQTSVYVGACWPVDASFFFGTHSSRATTNVSAYAITGRMPSVTSGRVAYAYALTAEAVTVDTACSSALVAVDGARRSEAMAIPGGASLACGANVCFATEWAQLGAMKSISPDGRCKTFDASADGFGRAEQTSLALLARMEMNHLIVQSNIVCVLASTAVNQDGASVSLTAPNGKAQATLVTNALCALASSPNVVEFEMHGTGTPLGDPIEMNGIRTAAQSLRTVSKLHMASFKSVIGHAEADAGLVGLLNLCQAMSSRQGSQLTHLRTLNTNVSRVLASKAKKGHGPLTMIPRRQVATYAPTLNVHVGCCSSFGFSGTNAHAVVEGEHAQPVRDLALRSMRFERTQLPLMRFTSTDCANARKLSMHFGDYFFFNWHQTTCMQVSSSCANFFATSCEIIAMVVDVGSNLSHTHLVHALALEHFSETPHRASIQLKHGNLSIHRTNDPKQHAFLASLRRIDAAIRCASCSATTRPAKPRMQAYAAFAHGSTAASYITAVDQVAQAPIVAADAIYIAGIADTTNFTRQRTCRAVVADADARADVDGHASTVLHVRNAVRNAVRSLGSLRGGGGVAYRRACESLYDVVWRASASIVDTAADCTHGARTHVVARNIAMQASSCSLTAPARAMLGVLCIMQEHEPPPRAWTAVTFGVFGHHAPTAVCGSSDGQAGAGISAALRSRHVEYKDRAWLAVDVSAASVMHPAALSRRVRDSLDEYSDTTTTQRTLLAPAMGLRGMPAAHTTSLPSFLHCSITGGTGALGRMLATMVTCAHAAGTTLLSRSGRGGRELRALLRGSSSSAQSARNVWRVVRCDACSADEYASEVRIVRLLEHGWHRGSVAHAGGVLADAMVLKQTPSSMRGVFAPKVSASVHVQDHAAIMPCASVTAFSSIAVCIMGMGQANYAAANATLDAWVIRMHAAGLPAASTQWGAWSDVGMATTEKNILRRMERQGILPLPPDQGCLLMELAIATSAAYLRWDRTAPPKLTCTPMCWSTFASSVSRSAFFFPNEEGGGGGGGGGGTFVTEEAKSAKAAAKSSAGATHHRGWDAAGLQRAISDVVRRVSDESIDANASLMEAGVDSLMSTEIRTEVERVLGVSLPATSMFDYPTIAELAKYASQLVGCSDDDPSTREAHKVELELDSIQRRRAFISCCSLDGTPSLGALTNSQDAISRCVDGICPIPGEHWNPEETGGPRFAAFMRAIYDFDAPVFRIASREAQLMDPQHRYLLDISVRSATQLFDENDGVFVGNTEAQTETGRNALSPYAVLSSNPSVACGRISYVFGLRGPSISIDTACSASSAACHFALMHHQTTPKASSQLVYGVLISGAPTQTLAIYRAGMLSPEGRCKVLDAAADGYTRGEGVALVRLVDDDAILATDARFPCVVASAINQDGRSSALTAPHGPSQQAVIRDALFAARFDCAHISSVTHLQMHGTGTALGDPIEVGAASTVLRPTNEDTALQLSANKSQLGHTELAAGIFNIISASASIVLDTSPGIAHLRACNPYVTDSLRDCTGSIVAKLPREDGPIFTSKAHGGPTRCVSAFAFQGTNTHILIGQQPSTGKRHDTIMHMTFADGGMRGLQRHLLRYSQPTFGFTGIVANHADVWLICTPEAKTCIGPEDTFAKHIQTCMQVLRVLADANACLSLTNPCSTLSSRGSSDSNESAIRIRGETIAIRNIGERQHAFLASLRRIDAAIRCASCSATTRPAKPRMQAYAAFAHGSTAASYITAVDQVAQAPIVAADAIYIAGIADTTNFTRQRTCRAVVADADARADVDGHASTVLHVRNAVRNAVRSLGSLRGGGGVAYRRACESLYDVVWRASASIVDTAADCTHGARTHVVARNIAMQASSCSLTAPARAMLGVLCIMQEHEPPPRAWTAVTFGVFGHHAPTAVCGSSDGQAGAGISAALRSRHVEYKDRAWLAVDVSAASVMHPAALSRRVRDSLDEYSDTTTTQRTLLAPAMGLRGMPAAHTTSLPSFLHCSITGGTGALGRMLATMVTCAHAAGTTLLSRSGRGGRELRALLRGSSSSAQSARNVWRVVRCDACSADEYASEVRIVRLLEHGWHRGSVAHAGGVLADAMVLKQTPSSMRGVFAPKVSASVHVQDHAAIMPCASVTAFSSIAVCIMGMGQANYAAANATLDAWVIRMHAAGLPAASTQWGAWSDVGMATTEKNILRRMERQGILPLPPDQGCLLMELAIATSAAYLRWDRTAPPKLTCTPMCWSTFASSVSRSAFFFPNEEGGGGGGGGGGTFVTEEAKSAKAAAKSSAGATHHRGWDAAGLQRAISDVVRRVSDESIDANASLMEAGVDSLMSTEIRTEVERVLGVSLPATSMFDYPTIAELAKYASQSLLCEDASNARADDDDGDDDALNQIIASAGLCLPPADTESALVLQSRLEDLFGVSLEISEVLKLDSINKCVRAVRASSGAVGSLTSKTECLSPSPFEAGLVCVPGVGSRLSSSFLRSFAELLPTSIHVTCASVPHDALFPDVNALASSLDATVGLRLRGIPTYLFGHSFGALVAHHWAMHLPCSNLRPSCTYVSSLYANSPRVGTLVDTPEAFAYNLLGPSAAPSFIAKVPSYLDGMCNDLEMLAKDASERQHDGDALSCTRLSSSRIVALFGASDPAGLSTQSTSGLLAPYPFGTPRGKVRSELASVETLVYRGGHIPCQDALQAVAAQVIDDMRRCRHLRS